LGWGPPLTIAANTLALWRFDNNGLDASPNAYNLSLVGSVPFQAGGPGGGAAQAGIFTDANYYNTPAGFNTALSSLSVWTWEFFVTPNDLSNSPMVFLIEDDGLAFFEILPAPVLGAVKFHRLFARPVLVQSAAGEVVAGNVYHFAVVCTGTTIEIYKAVVSGGVVGPHTLVAQAVSAATFGTILNGFVGRSSAAFPGFAMDGYIDNLRISDVARTTFPTLDQEVAALVQRRRR
jgi:hypothetical protein